MNNSFDPRSEQIKPLSATRNRATHNYAFHRPRTTDAKKCRRNEKHLNAPVVRRARPIVRRPFWRRRAEMRAHVQVGSYTIFFVCARAQQIARLTRALKYGRARCRYLR